MTGISAGGLVSPFTFLWRDRELGELFTKHEQSDIVAASILPGLLGGSAMGDSTPLAGLIAKYGIHPARTAGVRGSRGSALSVPVPGQQVGDPVCWVVGDAGENVGEPRPGIDLV